MEPTFKERVKAALNRIDNTMPMIVRPKPRGGVLFLNPKCMDAEDGNNVALTERVVLVLRHMFQMLGHRITVFVTYENETKVLSRSRTEDEIQEIKHLTNLAFDAFFQSRYDVDRTLTLLENQRIIPCWTPD